MEGRAIPIGIPRLLSAHLWLRKEGGWQTYWRERLAVGSTVVVKHLDYAAVLEVVLEASQKTFDELEPSSGLDPVATGIGVSDDLLVQSVKTQNSKYHR